jgi:hypothetical protein
MGICRRIGFWVRAPGVAHGIDPLLGMRSNKGSRRGGGRRDRLDRA